MRVLVLGGTVFLGRHLSGIALATGCELTLFNRGRTAPDLFPAARHLRGDRGGDLQALAQAPPDSWDACIDLTGYHPRAVEATAQVLTGKVQTYVFVSSVSVYRLGEAPVIDEDSPLERLPEGASDQVTGETYGAMKAICERAAEIAMPGRTLAVRPGLIVGPHDPTDRFSYWVRRVAAGGEVLAPGDPDQPVQWIDARDLASFLLHVAASRATGVMNAVGPAERTTMRDFLHTCRAATGSDASFTWVDEDFLRQRGIAPYSEMPMWVPAAVSGAQNVDARRARAAGLVVRPLAETVRDTLAWDRLRDPEVELATGLPRGREQALLAAWNART